MMTRASGHAPSEIYSHEELLWCGEIIAALSQKNRSVENAQKSLLCRLFAGC